MASSQHSWESHYPSGVSWDAPITAMTLSEALERVAATSGERIAIEFLGLEITYAELASRSDRFAAALCRMGIATGSVIGLYLPNTPYHPVAFFGAMKAGMRVVHLTPLDAHRELITKLKDSGARVVVTVNAPAMMRMAHALADADLVDHIFVGDEARWTGLEESTASPAPDSRFLSLSALLEVERTPLPATWPVVSVDDVALLQFTGGTTGTPKGAMLTHANLTSAASSFCHWLNPQSFADPGHDRHIAVLPLFHIYALVGILLRSVMMGETIILRPRFDVQQTLEDIERTKATWFFAVPTMLIALAESSALKERDLSSLRFCLSGGAALPAQVSQRFQQLTGNRVAIGWGMTETCGLGTLTNTPVSGPLGGNCIGLPVPGMVVEVVASDDTHRVLPAGQIGELRVRGRNVTRGYHNNPSESAAAFADGFLLTGDLGYMDEAGCFYLVDRKKDLIISGGFNVYPRAIEDAIYEHPSVEEVLVVGVPDDYRGEAAKAFIKLRMNRARFSLEELRAFLADKLGRHELPACIEFREALPRTAVGKLSKKELGLQPPQR